MRNFFREKFEALPESRQHLVKAIGAGTASLAMTAYGSMVSRPRPEGYNSAIEALNEGLDASQKAIVCIVGATVYAHIASEEYNAFRETRRAEMYET